MLIKKTPYKSKLNNLRHGVLALIVYHSTYDRVGAEDYSPRLSYYYGYVVNIRDLPAVQPIQEAYRGFRYNVSHVRKASISDFSII